MQPRNPRTTPGRLRRTAAATFSILLIAFCSAKSPCRRQAVLLGTRAMESPKNAKPEIHSEEFLDRLMRRQLRLSITCAATFLAALLALPLLNYFLPELMAARVFGFTLTWFILGVLFFPLVWLIAWIFIRKSIALEESEVAELEREKRGQGEKEK